MKFQLMPKTTPPNHEDPVFIQHAKRATVSVAQFKDGKWQQLPPVNDLDDIDFYWIDIIK